MAVPAADQIRLSRILADDLQPRIQWAYDLEQQIVSLSGGGLTSWGLASQAEFVGNGDPNSVITAISEGDLYLDVTGTPGLWIANGAGTVWTEVGSGGGAVDSVNGQTGVVVLAASDVGAQPVDSDLTAIAALATTAFGRGLLILADAAALRSAAALGTAATANTGDFDAAGAAAAAQAASQPLDSDLTAIAALSTTSFGRGLLALADAAAGRTAFGLGTASTSNAGDFDAAGAAAAAQAASQPLDSDLTAIAALSTTSFGRGLLALADAAALRTSAGLGTIATQNANAVTITGGSVTGITDLAIADGGTAASTAAGALANLSGQAGADFSLNSHKLTAVTDGTAVDDAATVGQVTNLINGRPVKIECRAATTAALPAVVYANGASGVGATLTGVSVGALGAMDGITLAVNDRLLVKNQVAQEQNGAYTVTAVGSGIAVFVLTRATDSDQAADLQNGAAYYIVLGTTLADTTWALSNDPSVTITMGTTALTFAQVDGAGSTVAGNGLSRSGNTLSIDTAITVDKTTAQILTNKTLTSPVVNTPTGIVKGDVGLGNVDNTTDAGKPVSTAQQTALDLKAPLASPALTGTPTAPTAAAATNTTQIATTAFVRSLPDVQTFTATGAGTWTKPAGCTTVAVICWGGGGGGGGGASNTGAALRYGGAGGGGGAKSITQFSAADLAATEAVTVGVGGTAGAGGGSGAQGSNGGVGGPTIFGLTTEANGLCGSGGGGGGRSGRLTSEAGFGGGGAGQGVTLSGFNGGVGTATTGTPGGPGQGRSIVASVSASASSGGGGSGGTEKGCCAEYGGGGGAGHEATPLTAGSGGNSFYGGAGGGVGTGATAVPALVAGSIGGLNKSYAPTASAGGAAAGTDGASPTAGTAGANGVGAFGGAGGGGGGGTITANTTGGAGGAGGTRGGGGGGGGCGCNTGSGGAGGAGGRGEIVVISW